jgi:magnesium transporter
MIGHVCTREHGKLRLLTPAEIDHRPLDVESSELLWVDIEAPDDADIEWLRRTFGFHELALEDVARRHQRAKIDEYPNYYFVVFYAARTQLAPRAVTAAELQFFIGKNYLVTIHSDPSPEITDLVHRAREGQISAVVGDESTAPATADLVYRLLDAIVDGYFPAVDLIAEWIEDIEEAMFASAGGSSESTLATIFKLRKDLLYVRKLVAPSRDTINVLLRRDTPIFGTEYVPFFQDIYDHAVRVIDSLDTYRDLLTSALDVHLASVSNDVSETVKRMTAITAVLMVNSLIAGIYGMNFDVIPELHWGLGYVWALGLMAVSTLVLWVVLRRIHWL